jgi:hypothetical protein
MGARRSVTGRRSAHAADPVGSYSMAAPPRSPDGPDIRDQPEGPELSTGLEDFDGPGLLGFVGVPEREYGRHYEPAGPASFGTRLTALLSAAGLPVVALGVAVLAVVIGGIAMLIGVVAWGRASTAQTVAERAASAPALPQVSLPSEPPAAAAPASAAPSPTPEPDRLDPSADYQPVFADQVLRARPNGCDGTELDLDEPRVLPPSGADVAYRSCADGLHLDFDDASRFAVVADAGAGAGECADAIRTNPGVGWLPPSAGTTVCVLTSRLAAEPQSVSTKLARLHVQTVADDETLSVSLTAWMVP